MGLRFFADHCIPNLVIQALMDEGHEVLQLKHHIPVESREKTLGSGLQYCKLRSRTPGV